MKCNSSEYSRDEIFKGFLLLSNNERKLHISKLEELIKEHTEDYNEKMFLLDHIRHFTDDQGWVDYEQFVNSSF